MLVAVLALGAPIGRPVPSAVAAEGIDVGITASLSAPFAIEDTDAAFEVVVHNAGTVPAADVSVAFQLPGSWVSGEGDGWSCDIVCDYLGTIPVGEAAPTITVTVSLASSSNTFSATVHTSGDVNAANNTSAIQFDIRTAVQVSPSISDGDGSFDYDEPGEYTVTVVNTGATALDGSATITVTASFDSGPITAVSGSGWSCTNDPEFPPAACSHSGPLAVDASLPVLTVTVLPTVPAFEDRAFITVDAQTDGSEPVTEMEDTTLVSTRDLAVAVTPVGSPFTVGGSGEMTVMVSSLGEAFDDVVDLRLIGPDDWTAVGTGWTCAPAIFFGTIDCTRSGPVPAAPGALPPVTLTGPVGLTYDGTLTVSAEVSTPPDKAAANNEATATAVVIAPVDYAIAFGTPPLQGIVGEPVLLDLLVSQVGPATGDGPLEIAFFAFDAEGLQASGDGWACVAEFGQVACLRDGPFPTGAIAPISFTATPTVDAAGSEMSLSASLTSSEDGRADNDFAEANIPVVAPIDLAIEGPPPFPGLVVTVDVPSSASFTVENVGSTAVTDAISVTGSADDEGVTIDGAAGSGWGCTTTSTTFECTTTTDLAPAGALPAIDVDFTASAAAYPAASITASVSQPGDQNAGNDTDGAFFSVIGVPDLAVFIPDTTDLVTGVPTIVTIRIFNVGSVSAPGPISLDVSLPASVSTDPGTYGLWTCAATADGLACTTPGPIDADSMLLLEVPLTAASDAPFLVDVTALVSGPVDPDSSNDSYTAELFVERAINLAISQAAPNFILVGESDQIEIDVFNVGGLATSGTITVTDTLPTRLPPSAASGTGWTCGIAGRLVTCTTNASLDPGAIAPTITIDVSATAGAAVTVQNTATVQIAGDGYAPDDSASEIIDLQASGVGGDLLAAIDGEYLVAGEAGLLDVDVKNLGTSAFTPTVVISSPTALSFGAAATAGWTCTGATVATCTRSTALAAGAQTGFSVAVTAPSLPHGSEVAIDLELRDGTTALATTSTGTVVLAGAAPFASLVADEIDGTAPFAVLLVGRGSSGTVTSWSLDFGDGSEPVGGEVADGSGIPDVS
ncbi:MAG TPA: hypothetical protein VFX65_07315, partial [Candidatus Limnocylindrales bacterium]|nr:hypothetical protein [Candidatus Limnocylindrales bacterium]